MAGGDGLHEALGALSTETLERHRAIASLIEELEAVDWYAQRIDACSNEALRQILAHNRDEEKEHACMTLEWLRRHDEIWDAMLRRILFREGPIAPGAHAGPAAGGDAAGHGSLAIGGRTGEVTR